MAAVLMFAGVRHDPAQLRAFWTYMPISFMGPVAIIIGAWQQDDQAWWWLAGLVLELAAAGVAGRADWRVDAAHFAERHGLILIIALGEAIIAVGATLVDTPPSADLAVLLGVGLAGACALWWAYFDRLQDGLEHALRAADEHETGHLARDVYSIGHYPMIVGIVFYAVALEEAFHDPTHPMEPVVARLFVAALALYLLSMAAVTYRAYRTVLYERLVFVGVVAALVFGWREGSAKTVIVLSTALLLITMTIEYVRFRRRRWIQPRNRNETTLEPR
jgi:low temperature requirement protein LtrA